MRVCMLAYTFYEQDNRVRRYAETLTKRGNQVDVISLRKNGQKTTGELHNVKITRIQKRVINEKGKISYLFRLLNFFCRSFIFLGYKHLKNPYDLVHIHTVPDFLVFAGLIPKIKGAKIILDIHDILPEFYLSKFNAGQNSRLFKMLQALEKISIAFSDHVIISNHIWRQKLIERSTSVDKCTAILNYPDNTFFSKTVPQNNNGKFIMIYPGSLGWHQGLDIAIKAFSLIVDRAPKAEFHIYGSGSHKNQLQSLIERLGLQSRIFLKKSIPFDHVHRIMANADLGIVPKRNDAFGGEAFSTKIFEFMSAGIPVIVSKTKIDQYYFDDNLVQFFEPGNEKDLAEKMLLLMKNENLRKKLIDHASAFMKNNNWDTKKHIYLKLVDSLAQTPQNVA
jgi:glycosyltransferase involved in cell wall biosynthesis